MRMIKRLYKPLCRLPIYWLFAKLGRSAIEYYENRNYDMVSNGELRLMKILSQFKPETVFDVGANIGEWSTLANNTFQEANIYSFEPAPKTYNQLKEKTTTLERVKIFPLGLSSQTETAQFNFYENSSGQSSRYNFELKEEAKVINVKFIAGESFCQQHGINQINFIKIDAEGEDLAIIKGFGGLIEEKRIDVIQFEYGRINIKSRALLIDFYSFFEKNGYLVGKIFPKRVDFLPYDLHQENFIGPNYVAVRRDRRDIIDALGIVLGEQ